MKVFLMLLTIGLTSATALAEYHVRAAVAPGDSVSTSRHYYATAERGGTCFSPLYAVAIDLVAAADTQPVPEPSWPCGGAVVLFLVACGGARGLARRPWGVCHDHKIAAVLCAAAVSVAGPTGAAGQRPAAVAV